MSNQAEKVSNPAEKVSNPTEKVTEQGQKVIELGEKVIEQEQKSNQTEQESNQVRLTAKQRKVLEFCDVMPRTAQEILEMEGVKYQTRTLQQYVTKLVLAGLLRPTTTHKNDSNRRYITAHPSTDRWARDEREMTETRKTHPSDCKPLSQSCKKGETYSFKSENDENENKHCL